MLSLVFAESSLELVPEKLQNHNSVISHSNKLGKKPSEILLDNSWHFAAMKGIPNEIKRGRPDLIHLSLLSACGIPLYFEKKIRLFVHTINDKTIFIGDGVHLPKSYHRFARLMEQLFVEKSIRSTYKPPTTTQPLLEIKEMDFDHLLNEINPKQTIGLSTQGVSSSPQKVAEQLTDDSLLVVGGFQKGHFSDILNRRLDHLYSVDRRSMESHVVVSRVLYEYEKTIFM